VFSHHAHQDLFRRLASLSYLGDVRMGLAEDSSKVERIVAGSCDAFKQLYLPLLQVGRLVHWRESGRSFTCALSVRC
jgi:translocator assembly and maintenance protein 41